MTVTLWILIFIGNPADPINVFDSFEQCELARTTTSIDYPNIECIPVEAVQA